MTKYILILSFSFFSTTIYSQKTDNTKKPLSKSSHLSLGVNVFTGIGFRNLNSDGKSSEIVQLRKEREIPMTNLSVGVMLRYKPSNNIAFEGGLQYSKKGYKTNEIIYNYGSIIDDRKGFEFNDLPVKGNLSYSYEYFDIPIRGMYTFGKKKIKFFSSIGLTTGLLISNKVKSSAEYSSGNIKKSEQDYTENYKTINLSPSFGVGISTNYWDKVNISLEPIFQYGLLKTTDTPISENLWSYGLNFTLYYSLN
jgi:hypothetical protein